MSDSPAVVDVHVGDTVRLRRPHPCGGLDWEIVRVGADIGLRCAECHHRIMLARPVFERRLKAFLSHAVSTASAHLEPTPPSEIPREETPDEST